LTPIFNYFLIFSFLSSVAKRLAFLKSQVFLLIASDLKKCNLSPSNRHAKISTLKLLPFTKICAIFLSITSLEASADQINNRNSY